MKLSRHKKWNIIVAFCGSNRSRLVAAIITGIITNALTILIPISLGKYFDLLFGFSSHRAAFLDLLPFSFWHDITEFLSVLLILVLLRFVFRYLQLYQTSILGELFVKDLRVKLFRQQIIIHTEVYSDRGTGRYLLRHSGDLKSIQNYFTKGFILFSIDIALLLITFLALYYLNSVVFLICVGGFLATTLLIFILNKALYLVSVERRNVRSGLLAFVSRQLQAAKTIKVFNKAPTEIKKYDKRSARLLELGIRFQRLNNLIKAIIPSMFYLILVLILFFVYQAKQHAWSSFEPGNMLAVVLLFITVMPIFRRVIRVSTIWELGNISFDKLIQLFSLAEEKTTPKLKNYQFEQGAIQFAKLSFSYHDDFKLFQQLSFQILPNSFNHIRLGHGQGQSTMIKLLSGLYTPQEGKIEFDGQDIRGLKLKSLRRKITFVSDEFPLLGRTVFEAVSYSRSKEKIPLAQAVLDSFQQNVPKALQLKLTDKVMEGGENLSKSQIKMLYYLRAALSGKPIVVIEEPLVGLETNSRNNILNWMRSLAGKKTFIFLCQDWTESSLKIKHVVNPQKTHSSFINL